MVNQLCVNRSQHVQYRDVWQLGQHRLICADSLNEQTVRKFIGGVPVDMILTDPPYNMEYKGGGCFEKETRNIKRRLQKIISFNAHDLTFYTGLDIPSIYIFTSKSLVRDYLNIFKDYKSCILVWCKTNPTPFTAGCFLPDVEYLLYFSKKGRVWNKGLKPMPTYSRFYVSGKEEGRRDAGNLHPTMKPLKMLESKIKVTSREGGTVLDPFGGSGTTLIACENTGRSCLMIEHEPEYCDVIIGRWERATGEKAQKIGCMDLII